MAYRPTRISNLTAYRVNGTPADCVALGTHHWDSVDLVLSGLNLGFNLGNAMWHSGTLAAAKQAVLLGIRGVALSVPAGVDQDFEPVKPWIRRVLEIVIAESSLSLINVNLPARAARPVVDPSVGAAVRRAHRPHQGSVRPRSLLVYGEAARTGRGRHRSLGGGAELDLHDAAEARPHRRGAAQLGRTAPSARPRSRCRNVALTIVVGGREGGSSRGSGGASEAVDSKVCALPREHEDTVRRQRERGRAVELMHRLRVREHAAAIADRVRIDPLLVHIAVEDFPPLTAARKPDAIVEPIEWREMDDNHHVVSGALHPAVKCQHAILVVRMHDAEALSA